MTQPSKESPSPPSTRRAVDPALLHISDQLDDIGGQLEAIQERIDARDRVSQHREFSIARMMAPILQAVVVGLAAWAASDWAFSSDPMWIIVKLGFAAVLQIGVLAAVLAAPREA